LAKYDEYYEEERHFGEPCPELIEFFKENPDRGKVLDLGCGQGRDALALASLGYEVTGVDISQVGIDQMIRDAKKSKLNVTGIVGDIYESPIDSSFDYILLDSMLHFYKQDREKEVTLVQRIMKEMRVGATLCILVNKSKITESILESILEEKLVSWNTLQDRYVRFPKMNTLYRMIIVQKE
jgi:2-polyprenyl-3-methyl-5-hydroxy-6-metoxy-1,4-benzoquinol methylase